jgi:hypothetical protein
MLLGDTVWSDPSKDVDYCAACYPALPAEKRGELTEQFVYQRCGIDPPPRKREGASPPAGAMLRERAVDGVGCRTMIASLM